MSRPRHRRFQPLRRLLLALALVVGASAWGASAKAPAAKGPLAPPPLSPRFQLVRDRIDELFRHRDAAPPSPDPKDNPFRVPGNPTVASRHPATPGAAPVSDPSSDLVLLQQAAATLKVSGIVTLDGKQHLIINGKPYKEGDAIQAQVQAQPVVIRIKQITRYTLTVTLNETETMVKF